MISEVFIHVEFNSIQVFISSKVDLPSAIFISVYTLNSVTKFKQLNRLPNQLPLKCDFLLFFGG